MEIETQAQADEYFEALVERTMENFGSRSKINRTDAESINRQNLGYYAGYYSDETRARVERLFRCVHPVFGAIANGKPTMQEAFAIGVKMGKKAKGKL